MTYLVKSQMSGETIKEFELFDEAKDFADEGRFIGFILADGTKKTYPRRYVVDQDQYVAGAQINNMLVATQKVVYAKKDWE